MGCLYEGIDRDIVTHKSWYYTRPDNKKSKVQLELPESARKLFDEKELTVGACSLPYALLLQRS
jgi:hypothetical protein